MVAIAVNVNGKDIEAEVDGRVLLVEFLRETLRLTGTHVGCDTAQCGACVVHLDGRAVKSCNVLAAQAHGSTVRTIEGLAQGELHPVQKAFSTHHGLQCGFCTPGMLTTLVELLGDNPDPTEAEVRVAISGNLCRCTGYQAIVDAALAAAKTMRGTAPAGGVR